MLELPALAIAEKPPVKPSKNVTLGEIVEPSKK